MPSHLPARAGDDGRRNVNGVRHLGNCGMNGKLPQEERNGRRNDYAGDEQEHGRGKPRRRREREDEPEDDDPHRERRLQTLSPYAGRQLSGNGMKHSTLGKAVRVFVAGVIGCVLVYFLPGF